MLFRSIAELKIPPFIATLGMMQIARGLALVFSEAKPIYFNDTPSYQLLSPVSSISAIFPGIEIPNGVMIMFIVAIVRSGRPPAWLARSFESTCAVSVPRLVAGSIGAPGAGKSFRFSWWRGRCW